MAKNDMDQPEAQPGGPGGRDMNDTRDNTKVGGETEGIRGIGEGFEDDEVFDDTDDELGDEEDEEGAV